MNKRGAVFKNCKIYIIRACLVSVAKDLPRGVSAIFGLEGLNKCSNLCANHCAVMLACIRIERRKKRSFNEGHFKSDLKKSLRSSMIMSIFYSISIYTSTYTSPYTIWNLFNYYLLKISILIMQFQVNLACKL